MDIKTGKILGTQDDFKKEMGEKFAQVWEQFSPEAIATRKNISCPFDFKTTEFIKALCYNYYVSGFDDGINKILSIFELVENVSREAKDPEDETT